MWMILDKEEALSSPWYRNKPCTKAANWDFEHDIWYSLDHLDQKILWFSSFLQNLIECLLLFVKKKLPPLSPTYLHSAPLAFGHHVTISFHNQQLMKDNSDNQLTNVIYFAIEKGDEDCRNNSLDAPEQVLCQWCCNIYKMKRKKFLHILTDSNLSSFCTYFHSRQTTQFSSLLLYFDRVIPLIRPPMISRWNVSSPRVLFVCVLDWRSISLNHNMKWSASCRSNIEYF